MSGLLTEVFPLKVELKYSMMANGALYVMMNGTSQTQALCADNLASLVQLMLGGGHTLDEEQVKYSWPKSTAMEMRNDFKIVLFQAGVSTIVSIIMMLQ
jgi:hypothetical protein